jgi:hypothetical protein
LGNGENSQVQFYNNIPSPDIPIWTDTQIQCKVPAAAQTGPLRIITPAGESNPVTVTIIPSLEADVAPLGGDGRVDAADLAQMRRYVVGLDPIPASEFQRVDCAPITTLGDGCIDATELAQVRRYAVGLDPLMSAGGPTSGTTVESANIYNYLPNAPTNLAATAVSPTQINLRWKDNSGNESGFKVFEIKNGKDVLLATLGPNATTYQHKGLTPGSRHSYRVKVYHKDYTKFYDDFIAPYHKSKDPQCSNVASATTMRRPPPMRR